MSTRSYEKLLGILIKEAKLQEKYLSLLTEERSYIVKMRQEELDQIQGKKDKLLSEITEHSKSRNEVLESLGAISEENPKEKPKLTQVISECSDSRLRVNLDKTLEELKRTAPLAKKMNADNGDLLKRSLGLVTNTIAILSARPSVEDKNYSKNGKVGSGANEIAPGKAPISSFNRSV
jgi:flagellar biosynthesis/type III secretory pathway chaperone